MSGSNDDLIDAAALVLNPHRVGERLFGDVGSTLVTDQGNQFSGVCIDTGSGTGFCAEHAAIAAMVTAGEYRIERIVAVWPRTPVGFTFSRRVADAESSSARSTPETSTLRLFSVVTRVQR